MTVGRSNGSSRLFFRYNNEGDDFKYFNSSRKHFNLSFSGIMLRVDALNICWNFSELSLIVIKWKHNTGHTNPRLSDMKQLTPGGKVSAVHSHNHMLSN